MARTVEVTPDRWLPRGEAVVEVEGKKPLVVWGGIPGERATVRLGHQGQHQAHGEWRASAAPDPHRVAPPCDRYDPCGGCALMHLDVAGQRGARRWLVRSALDRDGLDDVEVGAFVPSPDGLSGFRHVVKVGFGTSDVGRIKVGAWGRGSREVVPIPHCLVAAPILRKVMVSLAHHTIQLEIEPWNEGKGVLRAAVLRASRATGEVLVTLVAGRKDRRLGELAEEVGRGVPEVVGTWLHFNEGDGNAIFQRDDQGLVGVSPLAGREWIEERLDGIAYRIGPGDFFQTNPAMAEVLYRRTLDRLEVVEGDAVVDLYCGVGGLTLPAARRSGLALGVEELDGAVHRAHESARLNRLPAEFVAGPVVEVLADEVATRYAGTGAKVIVDPARRGLEPGVIDAVLALEPSRVAYVSCNPVALARDLRLFAAHGWRAREVEPFDMFPNTPHVECLAVLEPPQGTPARSRRAPQRKLVR